MNAKIELDDDVMSYLQAAMRQSGRSLAEVVNHLLRGAFERSPAARPATGRQPFEVKAKPMGVHPHLDYSRISDLLEHLDGSDYR